MTKVVSIALAVCASLFVASVYWLRELSVVPLAWFVSIGLCTLLYLVDRWGFGKINTVELLKTSWDKGDHVPYSIWLAAYLVCILFGHFLAYLIIGV